MSSPIPNDTIHFSLGILFLLTFIHVILDCLPILVHTRINYILVGAIFYQVFNASKRHMYDL